MRLLNIHIYPVEESDKNMMQNKWDIPEISKIIKESKYPKGTLDILKYTLGEMHKRGIILTELQLTVLTNHLAEMVMRSRDNNPLDPVDEALFNGVSDKSLDLAKNITERIGNLAPSEPLVLSIHFENAIENN